MLFLLEPVGCQEVMSVVKVAGMETKPELQSHWQATRSEAMDDSRPASAGSHHRSEEQRWASRAPYRQPIRRHHPPRQSVCGPWAFEARGGRAEGAAAEKTSSPWLEGTGGARCTELVVFSRDFGRDPRFAETIVCERKHEP